MMRRLLERLFCYLVPLEISCDHCRTVQKEWVTVNLHQEQEIQGEIEIKKAEVLVTLCLQCADAVTDKIRAAISQVMRQHAISLES